MKKIFLLLALAFFTTNCSGDKEDEDFTPYPGGKQTEKTAPKS